MTRQWKTTLAALVAVALCLVTVGCGDEKTVIPTKFNDKPDKPPVGAAGGGPGSKGGPKGAGGATNE